MNTIAFLSHPDRVHRMERTGHLHTAGEARTDNDGMPLNTIAHWQRVVAQSRLIIQTTTALEAQLVETDIDQSVSADKIGTTVPFYCAFAKYGRHHSLDEFEGAYIDPVGRKTDGEVQIAYIPRVRRTTRLRWSRDDVEASRIERLDFTDKAVRCHPEATIRVAGENNSAGFDAARTQVLRILLAMRFKDIARRKHDAEPSPWRTRFVSRFDRLEIGPDDLRYGVDDRSAVPGHQGVHEFRRGRFLIQDGSIGWDKPKLTLVDRTATPYGSIPVGVPFS